MDNCIYCKIVAGEAPSHVVYEDETFFAFLDIRPLSSGHALLIPKAHHRWVWDIPEAGAFFEVAKKIALAQKQAFNTDEIYAKIIGEEVPHAHLWLFQNPEKDGGNKQDLATHARRLKEILAQ